MRGMPTVRRLLVPALALALLALAPACTSDNGGEAGGDGAATAAAGGAAVTGTAAPTASADAPVAGTQIPEGASTEWATVPAIGGGIVLDVETPSLEIEVPALGSFSLDGVIVPAISIEAPAAAR